MYCRMMIVETPYRRWASFSSIPRVRGSEFIFTHTPLFTTRWFSKGQSVGLGGPYGSPFPFQASCFFEPESSSCDASHSDAAAWSNSTKDWPSGLCTPGGLGVENDRGSTVLCSHPSLSTLSWTSRSAAMAAGICVVLPVMHAKRKVDAAKSVVEDMSPNESGWSM